MVSALSHRPWNDRLIRIVVALEWVTLTVGIVAGIASSGASLASLAAAGIAATWVVASVLVPDHAMSHPLVRESVTLGGALAMVVALTLTGVTDSPYLLLSLTPAMLAAAYGGYRSGLSTATLSSALIAAVTLSQGTPVPGRLLALVGLYLLLSATVAQARRILVDLQNQADQLAEAEGAATRRLERMETAHRLLTRLADVAAGETLNPVTVGRAGLNSLRALLPGAAIVIAIESDKGPVVVARDGIPGGDEPITTFPLRSGSQELGFVSVTAPEPLDPQLADDVRLTLRPIALAFSNAMLLDRIADQAVQEERTRIARELHDEIGPSLAALGLSLDAAMITGVAAPELQDHLERLRTNVSAVVEEVRTTVADLRTGSVPALTGKLSAAGTELAHPGITVRLDERRPTRPSMAADIASIIIEAIRNAATHANAAKIEVTGWIDFDRGWIIVIDDGAGFDSSAAYDGHFGLIGMRERAERIGALLDITSDESGTRVSLEWGVQ